MTKLLAALALLLPLALATPAFAFVPACLPNPLPAATPPVFSREVNRGQSEKMTLDVWRVPCGGGHVLLLKATPITQGPLLCSSQFTVIQAGAQFDVVLADANDANVCDSLFVARTLVIESPTAPVFNASAALTLLFDGLFSTPRFASLEIPAPGVPPPPPAGPPSILVVALGCTTCGPGQTLGFELHVTNPGAPILVELKTGARLPGGAIVSILGRHEDEVFASGVTVIPLFSGLVLPPGIPAGAYAIEAALLEPELGVTLSRHSVALTLQP